MNTTAVPRCVKTKRLLLRCPTPEDGLELYAAIQDSQEQLRPWFSWLKGAKLTPERSEASTQMAQWRFWAGRELQFYLFLQDTKQLIGVCGLCHPEWTNPQFELCHWLRSGYEGHGYMTEAATAVVNLACEQLGAKRVEIRCKPENRSSIALAQRLRFKRSDCVHTSENAPGKIIFTHTS